MKKINLLLKANIKSLTFNNFNKNLYKKNFSFIYNNHPCISEYEINGKLEILDHKVGYYNQIIEDFLNKNFTTKEEIILKLKNIKENFNQDWRHKFINTCSNGYIIDKPEEYLKKEYENHQISTNYLWNILVGKEEFDFYRLITENIILNGYTVNIDDQGNYNLYYEKIKELAEIYLNGDKLSEEENIIRMIYLSQKYKKFKYYKEHKYEDYSCKFTEKDYVNFLPICFSQELYINKSIFLSGNKFYNKYNKNLKAIDMDLLFSISEKMKQIGTNFIMKYLYLFFKNNHLLNNIVKSEMIAYCILAKINYFLQTEEFCREFDFGFDFYISNALLSFHIWLICQRLNNFKRSKNSSELTNNIIKFNKKICNTHFQSVDTLRKISKFTKIEENAEEQKKKFHWHFYIYNTTVENNFFKIDALVWTYIFREKIPRYDDKIYKMCHYIIYHFNKFKELSYNDFKNLNFTFDLENSIPINYKDIVQKYNPALSPNQLYLENYNNFAYRTYVYSYKKDSERSFDNLYKTFIRYTNDQTFDKKNYLMMSRRKEDDLYDVLKDEEKKKELDNNLNIESNSTSINIFRNIFNIWNSKYFAKIIEICEKEDRQREMEEYIDLREIKKGVKRFSENLNDELKQKLYVYRYNLINNPKAEKDIYILHESKLLYPDCNVINKKRRDKNFVEKMFKL